LEPSHGNKKAQEVHRYRFANQVPLRGLEPAKLVNWCEVTIVRAIDEVVLYKNSYITQHELTEKSVAEVVRAGRSRWKTENENHNVLKTKGYHLEHSFGHGEQFLSAVLLTLNLLAFLFHA
jgi:hypothetical protein